MFLLLSKVCYSSLAISVFILLYIKIWMYFYLILQPAELSSKTFFSFTLSDVKYKGFCHGVKLTDGQWPIKSNFIISAKSFQLFFVVTPLTGIPGDSSGIHMHIRINSHGILGQFLIFLSVLWCQKCCIHTLKNEKLGAHFTTEDRNLR